MKSQPLKTRTFSTSGVTFFKPVGVSKTSGFEELPDASIEELEALDTLNEGLTETERFVEQHILLTENLEDILRPTFRR